MNVIHTVTHDRTRLQLTWPLIVSSLLSRFITDDLLRNGHYAVRFVRIKKCETEMYIAEILHDMARRRRNVIYKPELVSCFKQEPPTLPTHSSKTTFVDFLLQIVTTVAQGTWKDAVEQLVRVAFRL